jgi:hypothetical protein
MSAKGKGDRDLRGVMSTFGQGTDARSRPKAEVATCRKRTHPRVPKADAQRKAVPRPKGICTSNELKRTGTRPPQFAHNLLLMGIPKVLCDCP